MSVGLSWWSLDRWAVVVIGNGAPGNQISTGALGKPVGFLQQPQTHPLLLKQRQFKLFQTVNHAQIIWNSEAKPNGILGGHINIRSMPPKIDQIQNLLMDSNFLLTYQDIHATGEIGPREVEGMF